MKTYLVEAKRSRRGLHPAMHSTLYAEEQSNRLAATGRARQISRSNYPMLHVVIVRNPEGEVIFSIRKRS